MRGTVALLFAAEEPQVANLVTIAAPFHPEKITDKLLTREEVENWRRLGHILYHGRRINVSLLDDLKKIDVPGAAKKISCPVLILHGDADETVPVEEAHEFFVQLQGARKIRILKGADHRLSDPNLLATALEEILAWLPQHLQ